MRIVLQFIVGCLLISAPSCGDPPKSEREVAIETLDSMATESSTFQHFCDDKKNDSFAITP